MVKVDEIKQDLFELNRILPAEIYDYEIEFKEDYDGDPAVYVDVILEDYDVNLEIKAQIKDQVFDKMMNLVNDETMIYIRFFSVNK